MPGIMPPKRSETEQISIRVSTKLLDRLEAIGDPYGIKRSQLIHRAIEEYVEKREASKLDRKGMQR